MNKVTHFNHMVYDLLIISECPNFSDKMRNKASDLYTYIKHYKPEPEAPSHEEMLIKLKSELFDDVDNKMIGIKQDITFHINNLYDVLTATIPPDAS